MRAVVQRVSSASVTVAGRQTGAIGAGLLVFLGVHGVDEHKDITWLAEKIVNLRIFDDEAGLMNRSLLDTGGAMLIVSPCSRCCVTAAKAAVPLGLNELLVSTA